jgi:integrase
MRAYYIAYCIDYGEVMPSKKITDAFVRTVRFPKKDDKRKQVSYIHTLERGLALKLVVSYGGTRTFQVMTYDNGKAQSRKLGTYPKMKVADARAKAREYWQDPKKFEAMAETGTFREIAQNWIKRHVEAHKLRSQPEIQRILERYIYPKWQSRRFLEIRRSDVNELLDGIVDDHGASQADAVLAVVRGIMGWHQSRDENYASPIVRGMKRHRKTSRSRILEDDEIQFIWNATQDMGKFGALVKMALLTAQRREKIATMKWDDLKDGVWTISAEAREKGTAGVLKLPEAALSIIKLQPRIEGNPYVFAGSTRGQRRKAANKPNPPPFNSWGQHKRELDEKLPDLKPWTIHDLRRTARSLMSRAGVRPDIAERVLGHAIPGIEGVYDRHSYSQEKTDALKKLSGLMETILNPPKGNVISISKLQKPAKASKIAS